MANFPRIGRLPGVLTLRSAVSGVVLAGVCGLVAVSAQSSQRALKDQTIYVGVVDKKGFPPASLELSDLSIREDGVTREILKIVPASDPLHIAVLVDTSAAAQAAIPDLRDAVRAFAAAIWKDSPDSEIALYSFGERPTLVTDYSSSAVALSRGVDTLFAASGSGSYFVDAVVDASNALAKRKAARAAIVAFADEQGEEFSSRRSAQAFEAVAAARASLWTISRQGFGNAAMSTENRERAMVLGDVTTRTGGRSSTIFAPSSLKERFTDIATRLHTQFAVTYGRPESLIPPERLEVRLNRDGYQLTAPRWTNK